MEGKKVTRVAGRACGARVQRVQRGRFLGLTGPMGRRVRKFDGSFSPEGCGLPFGAQRTHFEGAIATRKM